MPYTLDPSKLNTGDIILTRNKKGLISWLIRIFTLSPYSHAAIYVGDVSYMEAIGRGVHARNVLRETFYKESDVIVLRDDSLTKSQIDSIINYVRFRHGMAYSVLDAIKSGITAIVNFKLPFKMHDNQTFCSQLVAGAFESVGKNSFNNRQYLFVRPKDIFKEKSLKKIDDVYRLITKKQMIEAQKKGIIDSQDKIVSSMMKKIWKILKQEKIFIKGVSEIDFGIFQIENISRRNLIDDKIDKIIHESGYLDMWKDDMEKCPENYSSIKLMKFPNPKYAAAAAANKVRMWHNIAQMRAQNVSAAKQNYNLFNLKTSKSFLELEINLLEIAQNAEKEFDDYLRSLWCMGLTPKILKNM